MPDSAYTAWGKAGSAETVPRPHTEASEGMSPAMTSTAVSKTPVRPRAGWRRLLKGASILLLALVVGLGALGATLRIALMPQTGEWATELGRAPFSLRVGVPQLVWLATTPWIGERLYGWRMTTAAGPVTVGWVPAGGEGPLPTLTLHCEPCTLPLPAAVGQERLTLPAAQLVLSRQITGENGQHLQGQLLLASESPTGERAVVAASWQARRKGAGWNVSLRWPETPVRHWVALLGPDLPELAHARIDGTLALTAELQLPERTWQLTPVLQGLAVDGLGTAQWRHLRSSCGPMAHHDPRGWLARSVLAAEDQRFAEHPGYDLHELLNALQGNQARGAVARGGSTLTQQLAKLLVTGGERTLQRKLREALYAVEMEQTLGKARILQLYLNLAPWGETADGRPVCGADAAARHWFGVPARALSPRQAVILAAMLRNPQREGERWAREGSVSPARLVWVAEQVRGVPGRQRRALVAELRAARRTRVLAPRARSWPAAEPMAGPPAQVAVR